MSDRRSYEGIEAMPRARRVVDVPPRFAIVPSGEEPVPGRLAIAIEPSSAFGDGTHDTTLLCLQAVGALAPRAPVGRWSVLDFGCGNGVLAIGALLLGASSAVGVDISDAALETAARNGALNGVRDRLALQRTLPEPRRAYRLVVANILRAVLVAERERLASSVAEGGTLVLSGLTSTDVPELNARYAQEFGGRRGEVYERGEWRALVWRSV